MKLIDLSPNVMKSKQVRKIRERRRRKGEIDFKSYSFLNLTNIDCIQRMQIFFLLPDKIDCKQRMQIIFFTSWQNRLQTADADFLTSWQKIDSKQPKQIFVWSSRRPQKVD